MLKHEKRIEELLENISDQADKLFSPSGKTISYRERSLREELSCIFVDAWELCLSLLLDMQNIDAEIQALTDPGRRSEPLTSGGKTEYTDAELVTAITAAEKQYRTLLRDYWRRMKKDNE